MVVSPSLAERARERRAGLPAIWAGLLLIAVAIPLFTTQLPVTDAVDNLTRAEDDSWGDTVERAFTANVEFRPLLILWIKLGFEAFGLNAGVYYALILLQYAVAVALLLWLFQPAGTRRAVAAALALTCFIGLHSSRSSMFIAVPVNAASMGIILLLLAASLGINSRRARLDWLILPLTVIALLLLESGIVLVPLAVVLWLMRAPGVSWRGAALAVAAGAAYLALRRMTGGGMPTLYTETGYGFGTPGLDELRTMFGDRVWLFWLHNVTATLFTVLFSEPRGGTFMFVRSLLEGGAPTWMWLHVLSSTLTTAAIAVALAARPFALRDRQLLAVGAVLVVVGSALGFLYTRDRIALTAGLGYVILLYVATAQLLERPAAGVSFLRRFVVTASVAVLAAMWTCRVIETSFQLRDAAWDFHMEWKVRFGEQPAGRPGSVAEQMRAAALSRPPADPRADPSWTYRYFQRKF